MQGLILESEILMILDWHSHIYTPEEAADDLRTWDGNTGPSWGEHGCPMVLENFLRAHVSRIGQEKPVIERSVPPERPPNGKVRVHEQT